MQRDVVAIYGRQGSGKSTLARDLVKDHGRLVCVDPSYDWERRGGLHGVRSLKELNAYIARNWRKGFRVSYVPPSGQEPLALHRVSQMVLDYQRGLFETGRGEHITLVCDEMAACYPQSAAASDHLGGFKKVMLQGRHYGVNVIGISQRPANVAPTFRDQCDTIYCFALSDHTSREAILKITGPAAAERLRGLQDFEALWISRGQVETRDFRRPGKSSRRAAVRARR